MFEGSLFAVLLASFAYFFWLSFSIHKMKMRKKLLVLVFFGFVSGVAFVSAFVIILVSTTHYNELPLEFYLLVCTPIAEELSKFLTILIGVYMLLKRIELSRCEAVRLGGGIGLGFGAFETFSYIIGGAKYEATIARLLVSVPFHISSAMLISSGLNPKRASLPITLALAIAFHSLSNFLALHNAFLQGAIFWVLLSIMYFLSEKLSDKVPFK